MTAAPGLRSQPPAQALLAAAAFALPAASLGLPSGYSWGALLLVLGGAWALATTSWRDRTAADPSWLAFGLAVLAMAVVWIVRVDVDWSVGPQPSDFDRSAKYLLALLAIFSVRRTAPPANWLQYGCWTGACLAGLTAAWQVYALGMERASGYTNAIQFGNIALLLAAWSALWWRHADTEWKRWWAAAAVAAGCYASLASGTRGGWVVVPALVLLVAWAYWHDRPRPVTGQGTRRNWRVAAVVAVVAALALGSLAPRWTAVENRLAQIHQEWTLYHAQGVSENSVGHRLAHWALAWRLGLERPWLGWREAGYALEKQRLVELGQAPPVVLQFGHAHQEWLDLWAKAGLLGISALTLFYGVPLWLYGRALRDAKTLAPGPDRSRRLTIAVCGLVLVVGFIGFGMTQVMFAHNSGNMMYLFMNLLWMGALHSPATATRA
ncbi:O-antigen ligase family protein [Tepidimonas charontis]|uniref:O-Antigen ligase n=1 Tax=Tepidimonas charontis TaxID=2267262 RepID=A0A554XK85_9BURK|nr:O-antigen ligase family protein [Tepidimonas charontis]TSE36241.1 O-Antigen ligase [Tepidimonas charontis]